MLPCMRCVRVCGFPRSFSVRLHQRVCAGAGPVFAAGHSAVATNVYDDVYHADDCADGEAGRADTTGAQSVVRSANMSLLASKAYAASC